MLTRADEGGDLRCDQGERRKTSERELFRSRLDEIIDIGW
jgi:hypothetical protein